MGRSALSALYLVGILLNAWSLRVWQKQWARDKAIHAALLVKVEELRAAGGPDLEHVLPRPRTWWYVIWYVVCISALMFNAGSLFALPFRTP